MDIDESLTNALATARVTGSRFTNVVGMALDEIRQLRSGRDDLLASCKELRDALAGAMRVITNHGTVETVSAFEAEMVRLGIQPGIGVRADKAIEKAMASA